MIKGSNQINEAKVSHGILVHNEYHNFKEVSTHELKKQLIKDQRIFGTNSLEKLLDKTTCSILACDNLRAIKNPNIKLDIWSIGSLPFSSKNMSETSR